MNKGSYITITFKEWANWIEYSLLRTDLNRVKIYNGTPTSMQNVFSAAPDITFIEDNEFVVVSLANDYPRHINLPENSVSCYLSIDSVEHFYAVSERGARLLAYTAANLKTNLSTDIEIAQGWDAFCRQQQAVINREKSIKFCKIIDLGLTDEKIQLIDINDTNNFFKYLERLKELKTLTSKESASLETYEKTKGYGGMASRLLFVELRSQVGETAFAEYEELNTEIDCKKSYKELKKIQTDKDLTESLFSLNHIDILKEKIKTEKIIINSGAEPIPLLALNLYLHYEMLLNSQIEINLSSLKFDLEILKYCYAEQSEDTHITVTYLLGELYPDIMINSLYAAKTNKPSVMNMEYLESLKPKLPVLDQEKFDALTKNLRFIIEIPQDETVITSYTVAESAPLTEGNSSDREKSKEGDSISSTVEKNISEDESKKKYEAKDIDSSHPDLFCQSNESDSTKSVKQHHSQLNLSEKDTALLAIKAALNNETVAEEKTWSALRKELIQKECKVFIYLKDVGSFRSELRRLGLEENFAKKNLGGIFVDYKKFIESLCDKIANKGEA